VIVLGFVVLVVILTGGVVGAIVATVKERE
jgi:hypothetical protein